MSEGKERIYQEEEKSINKMVAKNKKISRNVVMNVKRERRMDG